jgi:hypothetical protein
VVRLGVMRTIDVRVEGHDVRGVHVHHGHCVVGDGEEELVVDRSVDEPEHIQLARLHLQLECVSAVRSEGTWIKSLHRAFERKKLWRLRSVILMGLNLQACATAPVCNACVIASGSTLNHSPAPLTHRTRFGCRRLPPQSHSGESSSNQQRTEYDGVLLVGLVERPSLGKMIMGKYYMLPVYLYLHGYIRFRSF